MKEPDVEHGPCPCCGAAWRTNKHRPPCPPIEAFRTAAREVGYAIGVHGSLLRDFDLIAVPWSEDAVGNYALIQHLCKRVSELVGKKLSLLDGSIESKPNGRYACNLQFNAWYKHVDLSIAPLAPKLASIPSDLWQRCLTAACVVVPIAAYSEYVNGNLHPSKFEGVKFAALPMDGAAVGPDYWVMIEESLKGRERLHATPLEAVEAFERADAEWRRNNPR